MMMTGIIGKKARNDADLRRGRHGRARDRRRSGPVRRDPGQDEGDATATRPSSWDSRRRARRPRRSRVSGSSRRPGLAPAGGDSLSSAWMTRAEYEVGQEVKADIFEPGEVVDVTGWSKGRGFQGVVRRHGMSGRAAGRTVTGTTGSRVRSVRARRPRGSGRAGSFRVGWAAARVTVKRLSTSSRSSSRRTSSSSEGPSRARATASSADEATPARGQSQ